MDAKLKYKAKKIKLVFFDIDDTLRVKDTGFMPDSLSYVFDSLRKKGIQTGIASGRAIYGVVPEIMALQPDYFATINGSCVLDKKGKVLYHQPIPKELVEQYVDWSNEVGYHYGLMGNQKPALSYRTEKISETMDIIYENIETLPEFHKENDVYQIWAFEPEGVQLELPEHLVQNLKAVRWEKRALDVILKDSSKATGVAKIVESLGLKPENVLVFGDGPNDRELFDYAGISVAMGVSDPELQEKADFITKKVEEDGILYALEELGLVEKQLHFPQLDLVSVEGPKATIKTNHGELKIQLFPEQAPKTVANFVALSKDGYYDGVIFHRIIKDFMIQGGDPTGTGMGGSSIYGDRFEDEFSMEVFNLRGALSMANAGPNTNGSQFFVVQNSNLPYAPKELERGGWPAPIAARYAETGGTPHLDQRHTVFGQLIDEASYTVLDAIANVATGAQDKPVEDVVIETVVIED
ncbi:Cof-type HAD-IIB family hydrolase [Streptococcus cameli]